MTTALFAALADPLRLRAVALLVQEGELCVCELTRPCATGSPEAVERWLAGAQG